MAVVSDTNLAPALLVVTLFLLVAAVFGIFGRQITKIVVVRSVNLDDYFAVSSLVCLVVYYRVGDNGLNLVISRFSVSDSPSRRSWR